LDPISESKQRELRPDSRPSKWLILVNPEAGNGISIRKLDELCTLLYSSNIEHSVTVTESWPQLFEHASRAAANGYSGVIAHGGDGTVSQVAAGIIHGETGIPLAVLPAGNGNDWARTMGIGSFEHTVDSILRNESCIMDAALCEISDKNSELVHSSVFVNSAGIGLDAHVLEKTINLRKKISLGRMGYVAALISTVFEMPLWKGRMLVDGSEVYQGYYLSLTSGVCPYIGGGMMLSPTSLPYDDMLDTAVVRPISRLRLVRNVPRLFKGNILETPDVTSWRGREFRLKAEGSVKVELDGEWIPDIPDNSTVALKSLPAAITAVGPGLSN
jgi:diacylglycerol kinase (ATP)